MYLRSHEKSGCAVLLHLPSNPGQCRYEAHGNEVGALNYSLSDVPELDQPLAISLRADRRDKQPLRFQNLDQIIRNAIYCGGKDNSVEVSSAIRDAEPVPHGHLDVGITKCRKAVLRPF